MKLFLANASSQSHRIYLRFPEKVVTTYDIEAGVQIAIDNLTAMDIDYFKHHAEIYGYVEAKKTPGKAFSGITYSVNNELSEAAIQDRNGDLKDAQIKQSETILASGAAAVDAALSQGRGEKDGKILRNKTSIEIQSESIDKSDKSPNGVKTLVVER